MTKTEAAAASRIKELFSTLGPEEKASIISHGVALYLSKVRKRHFLAQSKVRQFEEKYRTTLRDLESQGLPDDADYELHEDYIMWHHWAQVMEETKERVASLEEIAEEGLYAEDMAGVGK